MGTLVDLLKYKRELEIKDTSGNVLTSIWIRVLGDHDMQESYRLARIASAKKRSVLRDNTSDEYFEEIVAFEDASKEDCIETIMLARSNNINAQAISANEREELPTLKEVATDPDAPTLEEQEELELEKIRRELAYQERLQEYVETRKTEMRHELENTSLEELRVLAKDEGVNILALTTFINVLTEQKLFRAVYDDERCTIKTFKNIDELRNLHPIVREQLQAAYNDLEMSPEDIKN